MKNNLKELNVSELENTNGGYGQYIAYGLGIVSGALVDYSYNHPNDRVDPKMSKHLSTYSANRLT